MTPATPEHEFEDLADASLHFLESSGVDPAPYCRAKKAVEAEHGCTMIETIQRLQAKVIQKGGAA